MKTNKFKAILVAIIALFALFFGVSSIKINSAEKSAHAAPTSFSLYLEGENQLLNTKGAKVSYKLKLNNPSGAPIWVTTFKINYDATCLTFVNGSTSIAGWAGNIKYNAKGYINIPLSGSTFDDQIFDRDITLATLNFEVNSPAATTYPFTFSDIAVGGIDTSTNKQMQHSVTGETFNLTFRAPNSDSSLKSGITVTGQNVTGSYDASTKTYTGKVPFGTSSVTVEATPNDSNATISGTGSFTLQAGQTNTKTVTVTAEDGSKTEYTVKIEREAGKTDSAIGSVTLKDASNKEIVLTQSGTTYSATIDSTDMNGLKLTATAHDADAKVLINGKNPTNYALDLKAGTNTIPITVTAQDGKTTTNYSVVITVNYIEGSDASMKSLSVKAGGSEVGSYDEATKTYTGNVENSISSVEIILQANDSKATVEGNGTWALVEGENTKTLTITAEDGTTKNTFTIKVTRASKSDIPGPGDETELGLSSLTVTSANGYSISLVKNGNSYSAQIAESNATGLTLNAVAKSTSAIIKINDQKVSSMPLSLSKGSNVYLIKVYSQDESKSETYTLTINVTDGSSVGPGIPVDPNDPNFLEIMKYAKFGGDLNLTLTKYDFMDLSTDSLLATVRISKDRFEFSIDYSANITVETVYGAEDSGEIINLTNGGKRVYFTSKPLQGNENYLAIKITDNDSGVSRTYIIKIIQENVGIPQALQIAAMVIVVIEIVLIVVIFVKIKKIKDSIKRENEK